MSFAIKIGNYRFSKNLGDGNFGKVKRKEPTAKPNFSRIQRVNWPQSRDQNSKPKAYQTTGRG